jgi:ribosomal protein L7/L12
MQTFNVAIRVTVNSMDPVSYREFQQHLEEFFDDYDAGVINVVSIHEQDRLPWPPPAGPQGGSELTDDERQEMNEELVDWLRQEQPIQAIKMVRMKTGCSLKDAKDYVDIFRTNPEQLSGYQPKRD